MAELSKPFESFSLFWERKKKKKKKRKKRKRKLDKFWARMEMDLY